MRLVNMVFLVRLLIFVNPCDFGELVILVNQVFTACILFYILELLAFCKCNM